MVLFEFFFFAFAQGTATAYDNARKAPLLTLAYVHREGQMRLTYTNVKVLINRPLVLDDGNYSAPVPAGTGETPVG